MTPDYTRSYNKLTLYVQISSSNQFPHLADNHKGRKQFFSDRWLVDRFSLSKRRETPSGRYCTSSRYLGLLLFKQVC